MDNNLINDVIHIAVIVSGCSIHDSRRGSISLMAATRESNDMFAPPWFYYVCPLLALTPAALTPHPSGCHVVINRNVYITFYSSYNYNILCILITNNRVIMI